MRTLNINNFYLKSLLILSMFFLSISCRQIPEDEKMDTENVSLGKPVSVKIKLEGVEWMGNINENSLVDENNSWGRG